MNGTAASAPTRSREDEPVSISNAPAAKQFYSIAEVADLLDVHSRTVRRWLGKKELIAHRFGRQLRISRADLEAFVRARREG